MKSFRQLIKSSRLYSHNLLNRDRWMAQQAGLLPPGAAVLDVGAGSCPYRKLFSHCDYKTQDFAALSGEQLRHGGYGQIDYVSDARNIPVPDQTLDAVVCTEMLEHVPEPIEVIQEFSRILKPGGKAIITAPLGSGIHQEPYHFYGGFTPWWYEKFLSEAGFADIVVEPNAGSFMFYSQESLRFLQMSRPFRLGMPFPIEVMWAPLWALLAPVLGGLIPVVCSYLDRFEPERRFTVGYHVTAVKR